MKKVALILLICVYSFATMGFSLKEFYCCGKLKSISLTLAANEKNNHVKFNSKNDCCKNIFHFHKLNNDHFAPGILINTFSDFFYVAHPGYNYDARPFLSFQTRAESIHSPPVFNGVASYITNCVFRI